MKKALTEKDVEEKKRNSVYYLMRDIVGCFPNRFEDNFLCSINRHQIARESVKQILKDEIGEPKPKFKILIGSLILLDSFVSKRGRSPLYELNDVLEELRFCFLNTSFKTVKERSASVIFEIFVKLYSEYIMNPGRKEEGEMYLNQFRKLFPPNDMILVLNILGIYSPGWILKRHLIVDRHENNKNTKRMKEIFNEFYPQK